MKKIYTLFIYFFTIVIAFSCSDGDNKMGVDLNVDEPAMSQTKTFAEEDGAIDLTLRESGYCIYKLLNTVGPEAAKTLGDTPITDEQYKEIKDFTDELVASCTNDLDKYRTIFNWVVGNITYVYRWVDNDPYPVFKTKEAICQGYSNLQKVMLHTQGIPALNVNGLMSGMGHAWNAVYVDGAWLISDATNNYEYKAINYSNNSWYEPTQLDIVLFEDENFTYNFFEGSLNVSSIKDGATSLSLPYSIGGYMVTSLCPTKKVSETLKEIYISSNIKTLGTSIVGLATYVPSLERVYVSSQNKYMESYSNVIYNKSTGSDDVKMLFIPTAIRSIELKPIAKFDKESMIKNLANLETIIFAPGTKNIGAYTVENCPKLHTALIPSETTVSSSAFTGVARNFRIIRGNFTNISQVKE